MATVRGFVGLVVVGLAAGCSGGGGGNASVPTPAAEPAKTPAAAQAPAEIRPVAPIHATATREMMSAEPAATGAKVPYEAIELKDGGTISGRVVWAGEKVPATVDIPIQKDAHVCAHDSATRPSPRLTVGADKGVKDAVVFLSDIAKGKALDKPTVAAKLDQKECEFRDRIQIIAKGQELDVSNSDPVLHNIHVFDGPKTVMNEAMPLQDSHLPAQSFRKAMRLDLACDVHYWMSGAVFVKDHPYYAKTDEKGAFSLPDVPPGTYKLTMWHEGWKLLETKKDDKGQISGLVWSDPVVIEQTITVEATKTAETKFELKE